ncbi:MAG: hypothetical protein QOE92_2469 [Chloroflexota bacterium]|jgi:uncharacterized protein YlxW (UPF0749 family)|nr:hypothetical protein [Chloroflexota bacterium]
MNTSAFTGPNRTRIITILAVTFLLATAVTAQLKTSLTPASNRVARDQQLVDSAQSLEQDNGNLRSQIQAIQDQIKGLNERLAGSSAQARALEEQEKDAKAAAGLTRATGPGVSVILANGNDPHVPGDNKRDWQVKYLDIQDVVSLLWAAGAEGVAVNGQRVVASSSFYVAGTDVLLNGVHLQSPYRVEAIGDSSRFTDALDDKSNLPELKDRSDLYQLKLSWQAERSLDLPAFVGATVQKYAVAG